MISKWFIGVKAKSKGHFRQFGSARFDHKTQKYSSDVVAQFTKQTALAPSFDSEKSALERVDTLRQESLNKIEKLKNKIDDINTASASWLGKDTAHKIAWCIANCVVPRYKTVNRWGSGKMNTRSVYLQNKKVLTADELKALDNIAWNDEISHANTLGKFWEARLEYINTKLLVREEDLEFKFMDKERRSVKWVQRSDTDTSHSYCNCCGGAIPSIPQLVIGTGRYGRVSTIICAICMSKLAQEAKIQAGKVSEEILEHYNTDRFLRSM